MATSSTFTPTSPRHLPILPILLYKLPLQTPPLQKTPLQTITLRPPQLPVPDLSSYQQKASKRKLKDSVDQLSGSKAKRTRARNFSEEEASTIVREASKHSRVLKGHFGPNVTDSIKEETWKRVTVVVNQTNGHSDRTWEEIRKKYHSIESTTRTNAREIMHERHGTGGGPGKSPRLSKIEELAFESIPTIIIVGLQCGVDSNSPPIVNSSNSREALMFPLLLFHLLSRPADLSPQTQALL
jgi:hypothetical protein